MSKSMGKIAYSEDQKKLIFSPHIHGVPKVVEAYAGCGKSTTLKGFALQRLNKRVLYLCFNRSVAVEAARSFPNHVICKTMHGLAYALVGLKYKDYLSDKIAAADVMHLFEDVVRGEESRMALAFHALKTFENWCNSGHDAPGPECVSPEALVAINIGIFKLETLIDAAIAVFEGMYNCEIKVSHSMYLKEFQLTQPILPFDVIMVDEAQDLNPVVKAILSYQEHAEIVKVGDRHQAIYEFRGASDGMSDPNAQRFFLNQTYRFGQNLADMASAILVTHKGAERPLIGFGKDVLIDDMDGGGPMAQYLSNPLFITRTKARIVEILIDVLLNETPGKVFMPGGSKTYGLKQLVDAFKLLKTGEGYGAYAQYKSWEQFKNVAELTGCPDASTTASIVERYKGAVVASVASLANNEVSSAAKATTCITTAHKSKGLEHPFVILTDDYPDITKTDLGPIDIQEINLIYVALTRATKAIHTSVPVRKLVKARTIPRGIRG